MNQSMQPAVQRLFQVSTLESVSREQLEKFVEEYPCFGFGHYLLARKLRAENSDQFPSATRKTNLYFSNPFWLQWMLENTEPVHTETPIHREEPVQPEEPVHPEEPPFVLDETDQTWPRMESPETPAGTTALHVDPEGPSLAAELLQESIEKAKALRESIQKINEDFHSHNGQPIPAELPQPLSADLSPIPAEEPSTSQADDPSISPMEEPSTSPAEDPIHNEDPIHDEEPPFVLDEPDQPLEPAPPVMAEAPVAPVEAAPTPAPLVDTAPLFEPLHTIDYFASQGIRLSPDENPTDPLGRQLKSFTEWLRTMRRLPQKDREIIPDRAAEQTVQNFAAHSLEGKEPVTETMAEVLAKQGMPERARIVYEKLSLLDPDKSAYFAAKIEQLNIP